MLVSIVVILSKDVVFKCDIIILLIAALFCGVILGEKSLVDYPATGIKHYHFLMKAQ